MTKAILQYQPASARMLLPKSMRTWRDGRSTRWSTFGWLTVRMNGVLQFPRFTLP